MIAYIYYTKGGKMEIKKEWLIAIRWMIWDLRDIMKNNCGESYDEEYYIPKLDNILDNIDKKVVNRQ